MIIYFFDHDQTKRFDHKYFSILIMIKKINNQNYESDQNYRQSDQKYQNEFF